MSLPRTASYRQLAGSEINILSDYLERHEGTEGIYIANRNQAIEDFLPEWNEIRESSRPALNAEKVLLCIESMKAKVEALSKTDLFVLGPKESENERGVRFQQDESRVSEKTSLTQSSWLTT